MFYERADYLLTDQLFQIKTFNGPCPQVLDFEDVSFPIRAANTQPACNANPLGADYVDRLCSVPSDAIERNFKDGIYDQLDENDLEAIRSGKSDIGSGS